MSHLAHLKRRISSIKTTEKLTHAMRLISMSLYSKLDKEREAVDYHQGVIKNLFQDLYKKCPHWTNPIFMPQEILDQKPLFIVISSSKGFCGGLNNMLFRYTEQKLFVEEHQEAKFITIGKKATKFVEESNMGQIIATYHDLNSNNFSDIAKTIIKNVIEANPNYSSVTVYSSFFKNFFIQQPRVTKLLPLFSPEELKQEVPAEQAEPAELDDFSILDPEWEQEQLSIVSHAAKRALETSTTFVLYQALVSEYAARFVAMDNATTNAENYLETLTLQFNKLRQALITREVSELSSNL